MIIKNNFTENDVKKALHINKFSEMTKEKIMEFVSMIPKMDKEVALEIIKQFPEYVNFSTIILQELNKMCDKVLDKNDTTLQSTIAAYKQILDSLEERLQSENLSEEQKDAITEKMIEIAQYILNIHNENNKFLMALYRYKLEIIMLMVVAGFSLLGINLRIRKSPIM